MLDHADNSNPFSTRYIRPGAIEYRFPLGESALGLVDRLGKLGWRAEIIGPHGSGKSTLLSTLLPAFERRGIETIGVSLHDGQRNLPIDVTLINQRRERLVLIVDGYEQLSSWSRRRLMRDCRHRDCGLLITAHVPQGFPTLFQTTSSLDVVVALVNELLHADRQIIAPNDVAASYKAHAGNIRETLFELYDLYELRRRSKPTSSHS